MGMAASQARLLTITARMHDIEFEAQSIQNAKVQLATQSDAVYQEYLDALDATTLTIKNMDGERITANFNNLFGKNAVDTGNKYALKDQYGRLIVSDDIKDGYDNFQGDSAYQFALYMIGNYNEETIGNDEMSVYENHANDKTNESLDKILDSIKEKLEKKGCNIDYSTSTDPIDALTTAHGKDIEKFSDKECDEIEELFDAFNYNLYKNYAEEIYLKNTDTNDVFNMEDFNYYVSIFKQIELSGGCVSIEEFNGPAGNAATDSDWLQKQIQCGKFVIDIVNQDRKSGEVSFMSTAVSSDTYLEYSKTSTIDKTALAKAEAKYEHDTKLIDQKDKKYDMDLSKLETEREALKTQLESVKKVVSDNIERTFGIFS